MWSLAVMALLPKTMLLLVRQHENLQQYDILI